MAISDHKLDHSKLSPKSQSAVANELDRRKEIERQLKENDIFSREPIDNIGDILWQTDKNHCFTDISKNVETITGYPEKQYQHQPFSCFMTQVSKTDVWPELRNRMDRCERFINTQISRKHENGEVKYYVTSGTPFYDEKNKFQGFRGAEKDITDLVRAKFEQENLIARLRHAQRLEAISTLAGGIAHDFNNILGGILGYTQLLRLELKNNPTGLSYTNKIISGCNRAKNLVLQILDFSRQRATTTMPQITDPREIVQQTIALFRASTPSSIKIHLDFDKTVGSILAEPSQIHQAVINLCTNARQAIEDSKGEINIQVKALFLDPNNHIRNPNLNLDFGEYITISVTDTGKGIETDTLGKIFNPYFTTKAGGDGAGLGLSVVHGIVTRCGGTITIDTAPAKGSTFTLYFPKHTKSIIKGKSGLV